MVTKHFKRKEFSCKCGCGLDAVDIELVNILERIRNHFNVPVIINSACRCAKHNQEIGGAKNSQHLLCKAADFEVLGVNPYTVQEYLKNWKGGLGSYNSFTHVDVGQERRWH